MGKTLKFGLIGKDISDSLSPALFKAAYKGKYAYDLLDGDSFGEIFNRFKKEYTAVNITAPFKEDAFRSADKLSDTAVLCGASNILCRTDGGAILADNSDFEGITLSIMRSYAVSDAADVGDEDAFADFLADKTALVAGCGGAGKAAAAAAVTLGYGHTIIMNRDTKKAEDTARRIADYYNDMGDDEIEVRSIDRFAESFAQADLIIYTVPTALKGLEKVTDAPKGTFSKNKMILEANYKTPVLNSLDRDCTYVSGLNWLFNQAVVAYEIFTGIEPDEEEMKKVL